MGASSVAASPGRSSEPEERKTVILTGASRGIGHATVKRFSSAGWRVITCSRQSFPEDCPWSSGPEDHIQIDLSDDDSLAAGIAEMRSRLGGAALHALVNNAAISPKNDEGLRLGSIDTPPAVWQQVLKVNLVAPVLLAQGLRDNLEQGKGGIVNVTSIAGSRVHKFAGSAYACSKAALATLTREMASDFGRFGIKVNAIAPGEIDTSILSPGTEELIASIPLGRLGTPEEVASMIYFLCSEQARYVTGAEIHVNGGQHV